MAEEAEVKVEVVEVDEVEVIKVADVVEEVVEVALLVAEEAKEKAEDVVEGLLNVMPSNPQVQVSHCKCNPLIPTTMASKNVNSHIDLKITLLNKIITIKITHHNIKITDNPTTEVLGSKVLEKWRIIPILQTAPSVVITNSKSSPQRWKHYSLLAKGILSVKIP